MFGDKIANPVITKAVIPVAGFGTRLLPATKALPKEMFPLAGLPVIHRVVQEAVQSGIHDILLVTSDRKDIIRQHFDIDAELENQLKEKAQWQLAEAINAISNMANISYVIQPQQLGLGDAIYMAKPFVGDDSFAVLLGDAVMQSDDFVGSTDSPPNSPGQPKASFRAPVLGQLLKTWVNMQAGAGVDSQQKPGAAQAIAVERVPWEKVNRYGIVDGEKISDREYKVRDLVEKPPMETAPSRMAIAGRYILAGDIFGFLERTPRGAGQEVQLTDAIRLSLPRHDTYAHAFNGRRYDIGNKLDFILASIAFGLDDEDIGQALRSSLHGFLVDDS